MKKYLSLLLACVLALALLFLLLQGPSGGKSDADAAPTPEVTAAPSASAGLTIAGVDVDPAADSFELAGKTLSAGDCASIASLGNLTTLSLTNCNISDVHFLAGLTQLRTLILSDNAMADASPLASLSQLRTLYLDRNPVADLSVLSPLSALTTLSIQGVEIADYVLEDLQKALPGCRTQRLLFGLHRVPLPCPVPICKGLMSLYHTWHSKCKAPLQNDRKCAKIFGEI